MSTGPFSPVDIATMEPLAAYQEAASVMEHVSGVWDTLSRKEVFPIAEVNSLFSGVRRMNDLMGRAVENMEQLLINGITPDAFEVRIVSLRSLKDGVNDSRCKDAILRQLNILSEQVKACRDLENTIRRIAPFCIPEDPDQQRVLTATYLAFVSQVNLLNRSLSSVGGIKDFVAAMKMQVTGIRGMIDTRFFPLVSEYSRLAPPRLEEAPGTLARTAPAAVAYAMGASTASAEGRS